MNERKDREAIFFRYLLGKLTDEEKEKLENEYFENDELYEELQKAEYDLIDMYAHNELSTQEQESFEQYFLSIPGKREKLESAKSLKEYILEKKMATSAKQIAVDSKLGSKWRQVISWPKASLRLSLAASLIIISVLTFGVWRFFFQQSEVSKGMASLVAVYQNYRPLECRITGLNYAPFSYYKDGNNGQKPVEDLSLRRAERIFLDAVTQNPSAESQHGLGRFYLATHDISKAIEHLELALTEDPKNAQLYNDLGVAFFEQGKAEINSTSADRDNSLLGKKMAAFGKSLEQFNKAIELDSTLLDAFFNKALLFQEMKQFDKAQKAWKEYLEKDPSSRWAIEASEKLKLIDNQKQEGHLKKPEEIFEDFSNAFIAQNGDNLWQALRQARTRTGNSVVERLLDSYLELMVQERQEESHIQLQMLFYAGLVEKQKTEDPFIFDLFHFYSSITMEQANSLLKARKMMTEAKGYYNSSEFGKAIKIYSKAKKQFEQLSDDCETLFAENWIGNCYLRIPNTRQSFLIFQPLSEIFKKKNYKWLLAQSLNAISDAQFSTNEFSLAIDNANQSLQLSQHIQDIGTTLRNLQQLTTIQVNFGNYYESLGYICQAFELISIFPIQLDPKQIWPFYQEISQNYYRLDLFSAALEFQQKALNIASQSKFALIKSRSYAHLSLIYGKIQNFNQAIRNGELALEEAHNVADKKSQANMVANSTLNLAHIYRQLRNHNMALEYANQAIQLYEKLKIPFWFYEAHKERLLALIDLNEILAAEKELETTIALFEDYRSKILEESNRNNFFDKNQDIYDIAIDFAYFRMANPQTAFQYAEDCRARSLLDLINNINSKNSKTDILTTLDNKFKSASTSLQLANIRERIPEHVEILQYSVLDNKILMWIVSKDRFESNSTSININLLNEKISNYLRLISIEGNSGELIALGKDLYNSLIKPIESSLNKEKQIYIVPDKALNYLPFGALISPSSGKYFIEDYTFAITPSSSIFLACSDKAQKKEEQKERLLGIGNPVFDLPGAEREIQKIGSYYKQSILLIGQKAKEAQVRSEMEKANIIHISSHYIINQNSFLLSQILLARETELFKPDNEVDGVLQAFEVYRLKLPQVKLVVLSACQTGIDRSYGGEGSISIARSFLSIGVPIVLASLWPVEVNSSAELMINFHRYRKEKGFSTIEALRQAQLDMLHQKDERYHQPHLWAPFIPIGGYTNF